MKLSARNQLKGKIVELKPGAVNAKVVVDIGGGNQITSIITMDAAQELELEKGKEVFVIIKASSVMLGTS